MFAAGAILGGGHDLPPDRGRQLRPRLILLRQELDDLSETLRSRPPA